MIPGFVFEWDLATGAVTRSAGLASLVGWTPEEVAATPDWWRARIHPDDVADAVARSDAVAAGTRDVEQLQYRVRARDGAWVVAWEHLTAIRDAAGRTTHVVGAVVDVSAQVAAQARAGASERRLGAALGALNGFVYEWDMATGVVVRTEGLERVVGFAPHQVPADATWWQSRGHPDDVAAARAKGDAFLATDGSHVDLRYRVRHRDGHWVWVWDHMRVVRDERGTVTHVLGCTIDVTAQVEAQARLDDAERRLRLATHAVGMGRWSVDVAGDVATLDDTAFAILGIDARSPDLPVAELWARVHPDDVGALRARLEAVEAAGGGSWDAEVRVRVAADATRSVRVVGHSETDPASGAPVRRIGIVHDVTAARRTEAALRASEAQARASEARAEAALREAQAANAAKDQFLAVLSHELRTPLAPVLMLTGMLLRSGELTGAVREHVATIKRNVELEVKLIDDLLDLTRIARGKLELTVGAVDMHAATRDVLQMVLPDAAQRRVGVTVALDAAPAVVTGDAARLRQVLWNLVRNAVKFTPAGGQVTVRSRTEAGRFVLEVLDTGIGIEAHVLPRIFHAFDQGDARITKQFGGLGLGLAISQALVALHDGTLVAESAGRDAGATFRLALPLAARAAPQADGGTGVPHAGAPGDGATVLLVEDHVDTAYVTALLLRDAGWTVHLAHTVRDALGQLEGGLRPDLLLSDLGLPDGTGIELLSVLRERLGADAVPPAVALSGFGMDHDVSRSLAAGFRAHLVKPVSAERLQATLAAARAGGAAPDPLPDPLR